MSAATTETGVEVLKFRIGEEEYCLDIEYVAEIVDGGTMTSIPNSEEYVEGVMDLRGETTTIIDPFSILEIDDIDLDDLQTDGGSEQDRIIVLDPENVEADGTVGWKVADVSEVTRLSEENLERDVVTDTDALRGVVKQDDGFVMWLDPNEMVA